MSAFDPREHVTFAAAYIDSLLAVEDEIVTTLRLVNDDTGATLGSFTRYGMTIMSLVFSQHVCTPACGNQCAVLHMAWLIEGCPEAGESIRSAMGKNRVEVVEP